MRAQARWQEISGRNRTHFCGAYWFYGFHEDGLNSAIRVAQTLGVNWMDREKWRPDGIRNLFGTLRHRRFSPARHEFTYPLFMVFLDIDRLPELMQVSRLTGYNRWNWASFSEADHFGDPAGTLRQRLSRRRGQTRPVLPER